jgi:hypothetical protein
VPEPFDRGVDERLDPARRSEVALVRDRLDAALLSSATTAPASSLRRGLL